MKESFCIFRNSLILRSSYLVRFRAASMAAPGYVAAPLHCRGGVMAAFPLFLPLLDICAISVEGKGAVEKQEGETLQLSGSGAE